MTRSRAVAALAATACATALITATIGGSPAGAATGNTVHAHTTKHHLVAGPKTAHPGIVELHNSGKHEMLVLGSHGHSAGTLVSDVNASRKSNANGPGRLLKDFAFRAVVEPHQTIWLRLKRGTVFLVDPQRQHLTAADVHAVRVTGTTRNASVPASSRMVIAHGSVMHAPSHVAYHGVMHLINDSSSLQTVTMARVSSKTSDATIADFVAHPSFARFTKLDFTSYQPVGLTSAHHSLWTPVSGSRGRYVVFTMALSSHGVSFLHRGTVGSLVVG